MQKIKLLIKLFIVLIISGVGYAATPDNLVGHKWYLAILDQQALTLSDFGKQKAYFELRNDHTFAASLGCGVITGSYVLTMPNNLELRMTGTSTVAATCQKQFKDLETTFINLLPKMKIWNIDKHVLYLKSNASDDFSLAIFSLQEPY